jgi:ferritin
MSNSSDFMEATIMNGYSRRNGQQAYFPYNPQMQSSYYEPVFAEQPAGHGMRVTEAQRISLTMQKVINNLIQVDFNSAYLYFAMSNYLNRIGLSGFGSFLKAQYNEEIKHAETLIKYLADRGGIVEIQGISTQPVDFGTPIQVFQALLEHEQFVTRTYNRALDIAIRENDIQSQSVIRKAIDEQVDEEATPAEIIDKLKMAGENSAAILMLDQQYGQLATKPAVPPK